MPLTDIQVRSAKADAAPYKLTDGNGMFLLVQPNGAKYRRLSYRFLCKQKTFALDVYPAVTLATARKKRDEAREQIAAGIDPGEAKKDAKRAAEIAAECTVVRVDDVSPRGGRIDQMQDVREFKRH